MSDPLSIKYPFWKLPCKLGNCKFLFLVSACQLVGEAKSLVRLNYHTKKYWNRVLWVVDLQSLFYLDSISLLQGRDHIRNNHLQAFPSRLMALRLNIWTQMKAYRLRSHVFWHNFAMCLSRRLEGRRNLNYNKNLPEIQKHFGVPSSIHFWRKLILLFKSSVQEAKGFIERKPFSSQSFGTWLSKRELAISSNSSLMTIWPLRAFFTLTRFYFITSRSLLYLRTYWTNTVFIDSS